LFGIGDANFRTNFDHYPKYIYSYLYANNYVFNST